MFGVPSLLVPGSQGQSGPRSETRTVFSRVKRYIAAIDLMNAGVFNRLDFVPLHKEHWAIVRT